MPFSESATHAARLASPSPSHLHRDNRGRDTAVRVLPANTAATSTGACDIPRPGFGEASVECCEWSAAVCAAGLLTDYGSAAVEPWCGPGRVAPVFQTRRGSTTTGSAAVNRYPAHVPRCVDRWAQLSTPSAAPHSSNSVAVVTFSARALSHLEEGRDT